MEPENKEKNPSETTDELLKRNGRGRNWITDMYDKMDVSVRTLDIILLILCTLIVFLFVFGNKLHLGG